MGIHSKLFAGLIVFGSFLLFLFFQAHGIYGGDSGDLVTAAATMGVPHPPGYPLYTLFGWIFLHIPFFTPSWRVTLASSLSQALTLGFIFLTIVSLTKSKLAGLFGVCLLIGNYLFFLYAVTPEVFGLFNLFVVVLLFTAIRLWQTGKRSYVYILSLLVGLSLSHHQVILFFIPALFYIVLHWRKKYKKYIVSSSRFFFINFIFFVVGLLPYFYIPVAARSGSIINWNYAINFNNFMRLVTRADYGTFLSGPSYGSDIIFRLLQIKAYAQFLIIDFTVVGIIFMCAGLFYLYKQDKRVAIAMVFALLLLGPLFYFYASFPFVNQFTIGTYERFLLPSYVLLAVLVGCGFFWIRRIITTKIFLVKKFRWAPTAFCLVIFLYPLMFFMITIWRFWGFSSDKTAENLGRDILASTTPNSILLLAADTPLFTTQYVRYALGERSDVLLLHQSRLETSDYLPVLKKNFPSLIFPDNTGKEPYVTTLIKANRNSFDIYTNTTTPLESGWFWLPHGLVFRLMQEKDLPSVVDLKSTNDLFWKMFHNPTTGILSRYTHLMLSEVISTYVDASIELGKTLLRTGDAVGAKEYFNHSFTIAREAEKVTALMYLGLSEFFLNNCVQAENAFKEARKINVPLEKEFILYEAQISKDCGGDASRVQQLFDEYEKAKKNDEIPLELQ